MLMSLIQPKLSLYFIVEPTNNYQPSCIAASILAFARREFSLNFWTPKLVAATSYSLAKIHCCLISYIEPRFKREDFISDFTPPGFRDVSHNVFVVTESSFVEMDSNNNI